MRIATLLAVTLMMSMVHADIPFVPLFAPGIIAPGGMRFAKGDVNGDGNPDWCFVTGSILVRVLGDGQGGTTVETQLSVPVYDLVLADLDQDGQVEMVGIGDGGLTVWSFDADGVATLESTPGTSANSVEVADFDGDRIPDILAAQDAIRFYRGLGGLAFAPPIVSAPVSSSPFRAASGDFDGDGLRDIAVSTLGSGGGIEIWLGDGTGSFTPSGFISTGTLLLAEDLNGDGITDRAKVDGDPARLQVELANGDGTFAVEATELNVTPYSRIFAMDLDGDPNLDLAVDNDQVTFVLNPGDGTFLLEEVSSDFSLGLAPPQDFNGDGNIDFLQLVCCAGGMNPGFGGGLMSPRFVRGDVDGNGELDLADAIASLDFLFGSARNTCRDAIDANDDGLLDLGDSVSILLDLFGGGSLPGPGPTCGADPTFDGLPCLRNCVE